MRSEVDHNAASKEVKGMKYYALLGRILYAMIFVVASPGLFSKEAAGYAAAKGVPLASIAVPLAGVIALLGGLSVAVGYKAKLGAWLLVLFLVPVTFAMHNFWAVQDAGTAQLEQVNFMKNISLLGGALLISYFGAGPLSLDARLTRCSAPTRSITDDQRLAA
jgi:putative oxidoreductase